MSRLMGILADYSTVGIAVLSVLCIVVYLVISIKIVKFCRKEHVNVAIMGMIPILHLLCLIRGILAKGKRLKLARIQKEESENEEEIDLGL